MSNVVKIDERLYDLILKFINSEDNYTSYPSIKCFIDVAVKEKLKRTTE